MKLLTIRLSQITLLAAALFVGACNKNPDDNSFNVFTIEDDKALGAQVAEEIASDPATYPLLSRSAYPEAYGYLQDITDRVLNSGEVFYKDVFAWEIHIIHDDEVLNAFCTPGGYIYVYTGLIKFLDTEDQLAGVMGHEIAHADRRHSTDQLTKQVGLATLLEIVLGENQGVLTEVAAALVTLQFSRNNETEADDFSVVYLCPTDYNAAGAAGFFEKIENEPSPPTFLSTHPNPGNRVEEIKAMKDELGCAGSGTFDSRYQAFKNSLP